MELCLRAEAEPSQTAPKIAQTDRQTRGRSPEASPSSADARILRLRRRRAAGRCLGRAQRGAGALSPAVASARFSPQNSSQHRPGIQDGGLALKAIPWAKKTRHTLPSPDSEDEHGGWSASKPSVVGSNTHRPHSRGCGGGQRGTHHPRTVSQTQTAKDSSPAPSPERTFGPLLPQREPCSRAQTRHGDLRLRPSGPRAR